MNVMNNKILSAAYGKDSVLIRTNNSEYTKDTLGIISIASTSSGDVYLNHKSEVYSWSTQALLLSNVFSISSTFSDFLALTYTGEVYKWAHIHIPAFLFIPEKISVVSSGAEHSAFLSDKGNLFVIGSNSYGQISLGSVKNALNPVLIEGFYCTKVACGGFHTLILGKDKKIYSCGLGNMGQLANGSFENSEFFTFCKIKEDLGEIIDIYCTELSSLIKFSKKDIPVNTFRPVNLKPKSSILAFIHRIIVTDAERNYLDKVAQKEKIKEKEKKKQLLRESEIQKSLKLFETTLISNWDSVKNTKLVANLIKKGLPSKVRGEV